MDYSSLRIIDKRILMFINKRSPASEEIIIMAFREDADCLSRVKFLEVNGYIRREKWVEVDDGFGGKAFQSEGGFGLTEKGIIAFERYEKELNDERYRSRNELRAWITLVIAILGFVGAIVALIWQGIEQGYINF